MYKGMLLRNVVAFIAIAGLICGSGFYKTSAADNDSSSLPAGNDVNSDLPKEITTSTGIEFVLIPAGEFTMSYRKYKGSKMPLRDDLRQLQEHEKKEHEKKLLEHIDIVFRDVLENGNRAFETKSRRVIITKPFYLGKYPVTQRQWTEILDSNPSKYTDNPDNPVENVSWDDAQEFISLINKKESTSRYRLPTSAEWEYASAGMLTLSFWGKDLSQIEKYGWFKGNSDGKTHPVGMKLPNKWNLYDMLGNVSEWVQDKFDSSKGIDEYDDEPILVDPIRQPTSSYHMLHGGAWNSETVSYPLSAAPGIVPNDGDFGIRLALYID